MYIAAKLSKHEKVLLSLSVATLALTATAQRQGLWVTPHFTIGGGTMTNTLPKHFTPEFSVMISGGAEVSYMITNNIGFGTGIGYGGYGSNWKDIRIVENQGTAESTFAQATVDVPMFFRYVSGKSGGGFFVNVGVIHGFLAGVTYEDRFEGRVVYTDSDKDLFSSYSVSPFVYFGGNIRCGNRVQMTIGPHIQYQVTDNFSADYDVQGNYLNVGIKLGVGIHAYKQKSK